MKHGLASLGILGVGFMLATATAEPIRLDVTAEGPRQLVEQLTAEDLRLRIDGRNLDGIAVQRVCRSDAGAPPASLVLYLDVTHLTFEGYQNAFASARAVARGMAESGTEVALVFAGQAMKLVTDFTRDPAVLRSGLAVAQRDPELHDLFAATEGQRIDGDASTEILALEARQYQDEERLHAERSMARIGFALALLADRPAPKGLVVYADTLRGNPGEHYAEGVPRTFQVVDSFDVPQRDRHRINRFRFETGADLAGGSVAGLLDTAAALGVRMYGVEGQGIAGANTLRRRHAQDFLVTLARETGGIAFLRGASPKRLVRTLSTDLDCIHLVEIAGEVFEEEHRLPVWLDAPDHEVRLRTRASLILPGRDRLEALRNIARQVRATSVPTHPAARRR